jgi:hypothetical protein
MTSGTLGPGSAVAIDDLPQPLGSALRRLSRRLFAGMLLDAYPRWAAGAMLAAGGLALLCRLFVPAATPYLPWLLLVPLAAVVPAIVAALRRAYSPAELLALADTMTGGDGLLLTVAERRHDGWSDAPQLVRAAQLRLPRLRPWRRLAPVAPALAFLTIALLLPQRVAPAGAAALSGEIAASLSAMLADLQAQELVTPAEDNALEQEIERVRRAAQERMDASAWEAADALRDKLAATAESRRDAAAWAQEALARHAAGISAGLPPSSDTAQANAAELSEALEALAESGLLAGAPEALQALAGAGRALPSDAASLQQLAAALSRYLGRWSGRFVDVEVVDGPLELDESDLPFDAARGRGQSGVPGRGGLDRGRADADLSWGEETLPAGRFKAQTLPPGAVRSPDDWAPIVSLPGSPEEAPETGTRSAARSYADEAGQTAWRRTLAPRHQSAVKKYFQP